MATGAAPFDSLSVADIGDVAINTFNLLDAVRIIAAKVSVPLPVDVVVAKEFAESAEATVKLIADVAADRFHRAR